MDLGFVTDFLGMGNQSAVEQQNRNQQAAFRQQQGYINPQIDFLAAQLGLTPYSGMPQANLQGMRTPGGSQQGGLTGGGGAQWQNPGSVSGRDILNTIQQTRSPYGAGQAGNAQIRAGTLEPIGGGEFGGANGLTALPQQGEGPNTINLGGREYTAGDGGGVEGTRRRLTQEFYDPEAAGISRQIAALQQQMQSSATARGRTADTGALRIAGEVGLANARRNAQFRADNRITSIGDRITALAQGLAGGVPVSLPEPSLAGTLGSLAVPIGMTAIGYSLGGHLGGMAGNRMAQGMQSQPLLSSGQTSNNFYPYGGGLGSTYDGGVPMQSPLQYQFDYGGY